LQENPTMTQSRSLLDFSDPNFHRVVASNTMIVIFLLKMTGILVTRCAQLHSSAVFLFEVAHGERLLTPRNVQRISQVLEIPADVLAVQATTKSKREEVIRQHLINTGRLSKDGLPVVDEDLYLEERFPAVVEELNKEFGTRRR